jgi:hypothetical protein
MTDGITKEQLKTLTEQYINQQGFLFDEWRGDSIRICTPDETKSPIGIVHLPPLEGQPIPEAEQSLKRVVLISCASTVREPTLKEKVTTLKAQ